MNLINVIPHLSQLLDLNIYGDTGIWVCFMKSYTIELGLIKILLTSTEVNSKQKERHTTLPTKRPQVGKGIPI